MKTAQDVGAGPDRPPRPERLHHQRAAARGLVQSEQQFPRRTKQPQSIPRFLVPAGTRCAVTKIDRIAWRSHTTRRPVGFERYERVVKTEIGLFYEFREGSWLMLVARRHVKRREDAYRAQRDGK
jgi:hypothetical protein